MYLQVQLSSAVIITKKHNTCYGAICAPPLLFRRLPPQPNYHPNKFTTTTFGHPITTLGKPQTYSMISGKTWLYFVLLV
jgi:hypothetical protein